MQYLDNEAAVIYSAKGSNDRKVFDALEWLAAMWSYVPNRGEADGPVLRLLQQCLSEEKTVSLSCQGTFISI